MEEATEWRIVNSVSLTVTRCNLAHCGTSTKQTHLFDGQESLRDGVNYTFSLDF